MITTIGFSGSLRPAELFIQALTASKYSHVYAILSDNTIIDATPKCGVSNRSYNNLQKNWEILIPVNSLLSFSQNMQFEMWLRDQIGKSYDEGWILGYPFFGRRWQDEDEWVCSELIGAGLVSVGAMKQPENMHRLTPKMLFRRIFQSIKEKEDAGRI